MWQEHLQASSGFCNKYHLATSHEGQCSTTEAKRIIPVLQLKSKQKQEKKKVFVALNTSVEW